MIYHDGSGHRLELYEESFPSDRLFMWVATNATCDVCWHKHHAGEVVETCLSCKPPQELTAA